LFFLPFVVNKDFHNDVISLRSLRFVCCVRHFVISLRVLRALRWLETPPTDRNTPRPPVTSIPRQSTDHQRKHTSRDAITACTDDDRLITATLQPTSPHSRLALSASKTTGPNCFRVTPARQQLAAARCRYLRRNHH